jgi:arylsulfatase A-like enzyme
VLVIAVDSLRADAISQSRGAAETPNLHKLVNDGVAYRWCFAHTSSTLAAHTAILSSQMPSTSGVRNDEVEIDEKVPLLADHLADEGWQTFVEVAADELEPVTERARRGFSSFEAHGIGVGGHRGEARDPRSSARTATAGSRTSSFADPSTSELVKLDRSERQVASTEFRSERRTRPTTATGSKSASSIPARIASSSVRTPPSTCGA